MSLLATEPAAGLIELPDGTFMHGPLLGSQQPRFRTVPARHRVKNPECPACTRGTDYASGCGDYKSAQLLAWAPNFGYGLDPWQVQWLTDATGVSPDGRWAAFECLCICCRQNGLMQEPGSGSQAAGRAVPVRREPADTHCPRIQGLPGAFPPDQ
jgi:hypothetical protein